MKRASMLGALLFGLALAGRAAAADGASDPMPDRSAWRSPGPSPQSAFEIAVSAGYLQPQGNLSSSTAIVDVIGVGFVTGLDVGYRLTPHWALLAGGQYHASGGGPVLPGGSSAHGFAAEIGAAYHVWPDRFADPYLALRSGYRVFWESLPNANDDVVVHGFDIARLEIGLDYRVTQTFAIGPALAADFNVFAWRDPESGPSAPLDEKRVNVFVSASMVGRFDLARARTTPAAATGATNGPQGVATR